MGMRRCGTGTERPAYAPANSRTPMVVPKENGARTVASPVNRPKPSTSYRLEDAYPGPGFEYTTPPRAPSRARTSAAPRCTVVETQGPASTRSEERRVGKEGRSQWRPERELETP